MRNFIPFFKHLYIPETVITAKVNYFNAAAAQHFTNLHGMPVRKRDKYYITAFCNFFQLIHGNKLFVYSSAQMRIHCGYIFTGTAFRSNISQFCLLMPVQKP